jgi:hypothetical protein
MSCLLVNYSNLMKQNKKNIENFLKKIQAVPTSNTGKSIIYIILFVNNTDVICKNIKQLNKLDILNYYFVKINHNNKLCKINEKCTGQLPSVLKSLKNKFKGFSVMCYLDIYGNNFKSNLDIFINNGFREPIIIENKMCLVHSEKESDITYIKEKIEYALSQYNNSSKNCELNCRFSKNCIDYLKEVCYKYDNEIGGEMYISEIKNGVCIIDIFKEKIITGSNDNIELPKLRMNFHSHPKKAYVNYNVKYGWPSYTDFIGFFQLRNHTIFHCITTLEGIYIMYFNEFWNNNLNTIERKFIKENYDFNNESEDDGPDKVVEKINNVKYKNHPVINVKLLKWEKNNFDFKISFKKCQNSCPISQQMFDNYKKTLVK